MLTKKPDGPPKPPPGTNNNANGGSTNGGSGNGNTGVYNDDLVGIGANTGANGDNGNGGKGGKGGIAGMQVFSDQLCLHYVCTVICLILRASRIAKAGPYFVCIWASSAHHEAIALRDVP